MMRFSGSRLRLAALLIVAVALATWVVIQESGSEGSRVEPVRDAGSTRLATAWRGAESTPQLLAWHPRRLDDSEAAPFHSPPIPKPTAKVVPTEPTAPPLPFKYLGRMSDEGRVMVLLSYRSQDVSAGKGDKLEGGYQLDDILTNEIRFTYLPLGQVQTLSIGEGN